MRRSIFYLFLFGFLSCKEAKQGINSLAKNSDNLYQVFITDSTTVFLFYNEAGVSSEYIDVCAISKPDGMFDLLNFQSGAFIPTLDSISGNTVFLDYNALQDKKGGIIDAWPISKPEKCIFNYKVLNRKLFNETKSKQIISFDSFSYSNYKTLFYLRGSMVWTTKIEKLLFNFDKPEVTDNVDSYMVRYTTTLKPVHDTLIKTLKKELIQLGTGQHE